MLAQRRGFRRITGLLRQLQRRVFQTRDANFTSFDKYARFGPYHWKHLTDVPEYGLRLQQIRQFLEPGGSVIDLGCGDGACMYALADHCSEIVGIDADYDGIKWARTMLQQHEVANSRCFQLALSSCCLERLGRSTPFDAAYCLDVIEHLPNAEELLHVVHRTVRPGGQVVIGTPVYCGDSFVSRYHVREFSTTQLRELATTAIEIQAHVLGPMTRQDGTIHTEGYQLLFGTKR